MFGKDKSTLIVVRAIARDVRAAGLFDGWLAVHGAVGVKETRADYLPLLVAIPTCC